MDIWTMEQEAENLKKRFDEIGNRAAFARKHNLKGGQSLIYQHITGRRPISLESAQVYADGFNCKLEEISPRLALEIKNAAARSGLNPDHPKLEQLPGAYKVNTTKYRTISAFGRAMGGFPERIFNDDGGWPPGFSDVQADVGSSDENAFLVPVEGESMVPRYNPGEYALVEPNTEPELEDDVLVRLGDGRTLIKKLISRRGSIRLGSYNSAEVITAPPEEIVWMYYVAHPVPVRKIKQRF
jgi:phage repressor protein C with HTH and peptisase S24 domain